MPDEPIASGTEGAVNSQGNSASSNEDVISEVERRRRHLHQKILDFTGRPAYFVAPSSPTKSIKLDYPCTVYTLSDIQSTYADNKNYVNQRRYQITYITKSAIDDKIDEWLTHFDGIRFSRHFTSDNLNHYIYDYYF